MASPKDKGKLQLTQEDIYAMRTEFFNKVTDPQMRAQILTIAFAYAEEQNDNPHAADMMAWYLAQEKNRVEIKILANEYFGYTLEGAEEGDNEQGSARDK